MMIEDVFDTNGIKLRPGDKIYLNQLKNVIFVVHLVNDKWRLKNKDFNLSINNLQCDFFKT